MHKRISFPVKPLWYNCMTLNILHYNWSVSSRIQMSNLMSLPLQTLYFQQSLVLTGTGTHLLHYFLLLELSDIFPLLQMVFRQQCLNFLSLLPYKVSKWNKTQIQLRKCTLFLYRILPHSLPLSPYNTATTEKVFQTRHCNTLQAALATIFLQQFDFKHHMWN